MNIENRILNIILFCMVLGIFFVQTTTNFFQPPADDISHLDGYTVELAGTLKDEPSISKDEFRGNFKARYVVKVESVKLEKNDRTVSGNVTIFTRFENQSDVPKILIGDRIRVYGLVRKPVRYNNPGQIDLPMLLRSQGITAQMSSRTIAFEKNLEPTLAQKFMRQIVSIREHYRESLQDAMNKNEAAIIFAILFGGYAGIDESIVESFTATGIVHILSVSGSHISLLAATVTALGTFFRLPQKVTAGLVLFVILVYGTLAGLVPPVIRAAIMGGLTFIALAYDREKDARRILTLCGIGMLIYEPMLLFHVSFQLSFAATAGLIYFAGDIASFFERYLPRLIAYSFGITISTTIGSVPIVAWYFNQISVSSIFANLTATPILELLIVISLFTGLVGFFIPVLAKIIFMLTAVILEFATIIIDLLAKIPVMYIPTMNLFTGAVYYGVLILWLNKKSLPRVKITVGRLLLIGLCLIFVLAFNHRSNEIEVHFIDVHQGDCALLITPHGRAAMFDTGGIRESNFDIGSRVDLPYLKHFGIRQLDYIFLTHAHEDHSAGAGSILKRMDVGKVFIGHEPVEDYLRVLNLSKSDPLVNKLIVATEGTVVNLDGVKIEIIYAPNVSTNSTGNEVSNVYRVSYGNASFLFTGDLVKEQESVLLSKTSRAKKVQSTVLKVGHHGSKTSSSEEFIDAVNAKFAVFCVGLGNSFGHPKSEVVEAFEKSGAKILRTDLDGSIVFRTDGKKLSIDRFVKKKYNIKNFEIGF